MMTMSVPGTNRRTQFAASLLAAAWLLLGANVLGQSSPPTPPPSTEAAKPATQAPANPPPKPPPSSLDDLLDIDKEKPRETPPAQHDPAADEAKRELDKQLTEAEVANAFVQAMEKMTVAADLLDVKFDAGLDTQRIQEDIIAKLAQLLDQARRNQQSSSSSSSSSSSQQQQQQRQQQQQQQQNPGQRQQNQREQDGQQRNQDPSDNRSEMEPPPGQDANPNSVLEESRSEWGNLPQRLREQLLQGRRDHMPSLYRRMIDEYYKRLAEEGAS